MPRFVLLIGAVVIVDTSLYAALTPLLPHIADDLALSKAGAGVLYAAYPAGALVGGIPMGLAAARFGPRNAVLAGLVALCAASLAFAFGHDAWTLGASRFVQGVGSAASWAGGLAWLIARTPRERRGETVGAAMGAALFGALFGPVIGGVAGVVGTRPTFAALAALVAVLLLGALRTEGVPGTLDPLRGMRAGLAEPQLRAGLAAVTLPALLFGIFAVLVSFELDAAGWGTVAIGAVFLAAAALESVLNPLLGRLVDRRGYAGPMRVALVASALASLGLALSARPAVVVPLALAAALAYGAFYSPGMALISLGADRAGLAQGVAMGLMNVAWAAGNVLGPAAGGAVAQATSNAVPFGAAAALCVASLLATHPRVTKAREHEGAAASPPR